MLCKIADLIVEISEAGGMASRCKAYICNEEREADIVIDKDRYNYHRYPELPKETVAYNHSGLQFYRKLLEKGGMMLHSSGVVYEGRAYLFSGPSGVGKSTHTGMWLDIFKDSYIINDDKPALRRLEGKWYAYGTPWSGKHCLNCNARAPLAGICFLERGEENKISPISGKEALIELFSQTTRYQLSEEQMDLVLGHISALIGEVPIYRMSCLPNRAAPELSYSVMSRGLKERENED